MIRSLYLHSTSGRPKLRIGVLLDSFVLSKWQEQVLESIRQCDFAELSLVVLNAAASAEPPPRVSLPVRLWRILRRREARRLILFTLYEKFDRRFFATDSRVDPFFPVDCTLWLAALPCLRVQPIVKGAAHWFRDEDVQAVRDHDLDVVLRFGFNIIRGEMLECARYGIWSYHHGDNDYYRGGPSGFWELFDGRPVAGVLLQVLTPGIDAGRVLCKAQVATPSGARGISQFLNQVQQFWGGLPFVIQKLHELHEHGWEFVQNKMVENRFAGARKVYRRPSNGEMLRFLTGRVPGKVWRKALRRTNTLPYWNVAVRRGDAYLDPSSPSPSLDGFRWMETPRGHFYADPFLIPKDGVTWLFFEDYLYAEERGIIACAPLSGSGEVGPTEVVLDLPYHLSYPFIHCEDGEVFMIPETGQNQTVELYRAEQFPRVWRREKVLLQGVRAVDTTLWRQDGVYWFFVTAITDHESSYQLLLFSSNSLTGEWKYHPANPLSLDVRAARAAGSIFHHEGKLIRPAQDCSIAYGRAIRFFEIRKLNRNEYEERPLGGVEPTWSPGLACTHTYNRAPGFEVVDGGRDLPVSEAL